MITIPSFLNYERKVTLNNILISRQTICLNCMVTTLKLDKAEPPLFLICVLFFKRLNSQSTNFANISKNSASEYHLQRQVISL